MVRALEFGGGCHRFGLGVVFSQALHHDGVSLCY